MPFDGLMSLYVSRRCFGLSQGGIVPSYGHRHPPLLPGPRRPARIGLVLRRPWQAWRAALDVGVIFDRTGSYRRFRQRLLWNLLHIAIAWWLFTRAGAAAGLSREVVDRRGVSHRILVEHEVPGAGMITVREPANVLRQRAQHHRQGTWRVAPPIQQGRRADRLGIGTEERPALPRWPGEDRPRVVAQLLLGAGRQVAPAFRPLDRRHEDRQAASTSPALIFSAWPGCGPALRRAPRLAQAGVELAAGLGQHQPADQFRPLLRHRKAMWPPREWPIRSTAPMLSHR